MTEHTHAAPRAQWSSKWAFILAGAASAVGLGNIWRFPYLAAKYGGGTFILVYLVLVFTVGLSLLILENALGRHTRQSCIGAFKGNFKWVGLLAAAVPFIITPYYCLIGGWVTKYATAYMTDGAAALADGGGYFVDFITGPWASFIFMFIFIGLVMLVVGLGVKSGIEKLNLVLMPALLFIALGIAVFALTMPGAIEGVKFYLIPDFSKLSAELVLGAIGQMFYSMSLAMGIMITYGSYLSKEDHLVKSATSIASFDVGISLIAGLMIIPAAFVTMGSADAVAAKSGPSLMFVVLPEVFQSMGAIAAPLGVVFFLLVFFAALTSAISLAETMVSIICDGRHISRGKSLAIVAAFTFIAGTIINLGYNHWSFIEPLGAGSSLLDFADFLSNTIMMPIVAIMTCIFVGWVMKPQTLIDEIELNGKWKLAGAWTIIIKYVAPILLAAVLIAFTLATFGVLNI